MSVPKQQIHLRKSSKDGDENATSVSPTAPEVTISEPNGNGAPNVLLATSPRARTQSTPHNYGHGRSASAVNGLPPSAGPYRSTFSQRSSGLPPISPLRSSFSVPLPHQPQMNGHSRTRTVSTPFSPSAPSPLSTSFPANTLQPPKSPNGPSKMATSNSAPDSSEPSKHSRRHSRMHSRNLSVFFPRPGSITTSSIAEDGSQEVQLAIDEEAPLMPSAGSSVSVPGSRRGPVTPLGQGFTFGARPPSNLPTPEFIAAPRSASSASKRGHHHKHSLSHNFFSFLEPGGGSPLMNEDQLHTQPTPTPISPWGPMSAFPETAASSQSGFKLPPSNGHTDLWQAQPTEISTAALSSSVGQFVLGSYMWVMGQQVGSLSVTGLGYWVVFDSFGVALSGVVPGWLASGSKGGSGEKERVRRPYGNGRVETVLMFAQAVYLMFSSVYVCKETVEHLLLSAGGGEGHHHHHGDEDEGVGIAFPIFMTFITFLSLLGTAIFFENNTNIVNITGNRIPSLASFLRSIWSPSRHAHDSPPSSPIALILSNPFVASPLLFCAAILSVALLIPIGQHRVADLVLASIIAVLTFKVSYRASVVLGTVLLQTSPPRGLSSGKMEAFLRAMREVERHPHVLHLPAPHIWQLTPSLSSTPLTDPRGRSKPASALESLVVTLELHVRDDLGDDDVLKLTKWAWERCVSALGSLKDFKELGEEGGPEVTVGVVRG